MRKRLALVDSASAFAGHLTQQKFVHILAGLDAEIAYCAAEVPQVRRWGTAGTLLLTCILASL